MYHTEKLASFLPSDALCSRQHEANTELKNRLSASFPDEWTQTPGLELNRQGFISAALYLVLSRCDKGVLYHTVASACCQTE